MAAIYFTYVSILFGSFIIFYAFGYLLLKLCKISLSGFAEHTFATLLLGLTFFVILTSCYVTAFRTVNTLFIPMLIYFGYLSYGKSLVVQTLPSLKEIIIFSVGSVIVFTWKFGQIFNAGSSIPLLTHNDIVFYANCIDYLLVTGNENSSVDYINSSNGTSPYHYYHLWAGAGIKSIFSSNTLLTLHLVIYSIGSIICWIGIAAIFRTIKKSLDSIDYVVCLSLTFFTSIALDFYIHLPFLQYIFVFAQNTYTLPKLFPVFSFTIASLLFFLNNKQFEGVLCLMCMVVASIATAAAVIPAIIAWQVLKIFFHSKINLKIIVTPILLSVAIFCFYKFLTVETSSHVSTDFSDVFIKFGDAKYLRTAINIVGGTSIQCALIYLPFFVFFFIYNRPLNFKKWLFASDYIQLIVLSAAAGLTGWALLHHKTTSTQLFYIVTIPWLNIFCMYILLYTLHISSKKIQIAILTTIFLGIGIWNSLKLYRFEYPYSKEYLTSVIGQRHSHIGAFMYNRIDYSFPFSYISNLAVLGNYLAYAEDPTLLVSISVFDFPLSDDPLLHNMQNEALKNSPFGIYVERQKSNQLFKSIEHSKVSFLKDFGINYLIMTKNVVLSPLIEGLIVQKFVDKNTGEIFMKLATQPESQLAK